MAEEGEGNEGPFPDVGLLLLLLLLQLLLTITGLPPPIDIPSAPTTLPEGKFDAVCCAVPRLTEQAWLLLCKGWNPELNWDGAEGVWDEDAAGDDDMAKGGAVLRLGLLKGVPPGSVPPDITSIALGNCDQPSQDIHQYLKYT